MVHSKIMDIVPDVHSGHVFLGSFDIYNILFALALLLSTFCALCSGIRLVRRRGSTRDRKKHA